MKRFFSLIMVFLLICTVVSCNKKKKEGKPEEEIPAFEEQVTKEISAEEGGTVESSDGKTSIEIPGGALDADTTITMTIYDAEGYTGTEGQKVISKVVEFEPSGTVFKKPVIITMAAAEDVEGQVFSAAVYRDEKGKWSYNEHGAYAVLAGRDAAGDPVIQSAAGVPVTLNEAGDPIMQSAAGDPIMMAAAGDPIMLASAGDPIMMNAAGDPIMNAAAGDPIMMTTGHFSAYTFITVKSDETAVEEPDTERPVKEDDDEPAEEDDDEPAEDDDDEPVAEDDDDLVVEDDDDLVDDDDIISEPEGPFYSKVVCTGLRTCFGHDGVLNECPAQNEELGGQDAGYIFRKSCVPKSFERIAKADDDVTPYRQIKDNNTGLTWIFTSESGVYEDVAPYCGDTLATYAGGGWRMPTPAELLTIADHDIYNGSYAAIKDVYFQEIAGGCEEGCDSFWADGGKFYLDTEYGAIAVNRKETVRGLLCVKGDEYGKVAESDYVTVPENGEEMIRDTKTNLYWQKTSVSGQTWPQALLYCENLTYAGHDDWRLPNKNELASLVDFTKENPASSFPAGMPAEQFVSSTFTLVVGEAIVDMKTGEAGNPSMQHPQVKSIKRGVDSGARYSVICVRSDLTPYPENGIPTCGADGYAPCKGANNITWSPRLIYNDYEMESVRWLNVAKDCRDMKGGKWRIPTISDIRTLFSDDVFKTGGTCEVTAEHSDYSSYDSECTSVEVAGHETVLHDYGILLSGTFSNANSDYGRDQWNVWTIDMSSGGMSDVSTVSASQLVARCVLDNSIEDPKPIPYTDETAGLVWSSISEEGDWRDAVEYCGTLVEGGSDNWRVPNIAELQTLIRNCDLEGTSSCAPDLTGKYSVFSDIPLLLSSEVIDNSYMTVVDFIEAVTDRNRNLSDAYADMQVRCVRLTEDPLENPDKLDEEEDFPRSDEDFGLSWSKKSDLIYYREDAEDYCNSLNVAEYGYEYDEDHELMSDVYWRLPSVDEYLELLVEDDQECSSGCTDLGSLETGDRVGCFCDYTFKSHSIFNDFGLFWTSSTGESENSYLFDFTSGEVVGGNIYNPAYVRCVSYVQM